jgi:exopolyphosphatase/guanosine-5'-triphosphate,3'-diphosphate pyrophosphatase
MRRAVIDIGTNTVKLLVADLQHGRLSPVLEKDQTTRLGEGLNRSRQLSAAAIQRTVQAIEQFLAEARALGATDIVALATSAARDALNRNEFLAASPLPVEVLDAEREAALIYRGVATDPACSGQPLLVLDVGGGSAEIIQGKAETVERWTSLPLGAVRLTEQFGDERFAELCAHLRRTLQQALQGFSLHGRTFIGTGGSIITLARIAGAGPDHAVLSQQQIRELLARLHALPLAERKKLPGLPPERADIIVAGTAVFIVAMEILGAPAIAVSVRTLRYGALA